jgi:hypothetical protein
MRKRAEKKAARRPITEEMKKLSFDTTNVRRFLRGLGDTSHQVGLSLIEMGAKGEISDDLYKRSSSCVLAAALSARFGVPPWRLSVWASSPIQIISDCGRERFWASRPIKEFVLQFDQGLWPELDKDCTILG